MGGIVHEWVVAHLVKVVIWELLVWTGFTAYVYMKALAYQREIFESVHRSVYIETNRMPGAGGKSMASEAFQITKVISGLFMMAEILFLVVILV